MYVLSGRVVGDKVGIIGVNMLTCCVAFLLILILILSNKGYIFLITDCKKPM